MIQMLWQKMVTNPSIDWKMEGGVVSYCVQLHSKLYFWQDSPSCTSVLSQL